MNIQVEYVLAQQCDLMIMGDSGYGDLVYNHMCCGFPLHDRGVAPHRCICPPKIRLHQGGFTCDRGNQALCGNPDHRGGDITKSLNDPTNNKGANFSLTADAFLSNTEVFFTAQFDEKKVMLQEIGDRARNIVAESVKEARTGLCMKYDHGPTRHIKGC